MRLSCTLNLLFQQDQILLVKGVRTALWWQQPILTAPSERDCAVSDCVCVHSVCLQGLPSRAGEQHSYFPPQSGRTYFTENFGYNIYIYRQKSQ